MTEHLTPSEWDEMDEAARRKHHLAVLHELRAQSHADGVQRRAIEWALHIAEEHHEQMKEKGR